MSRHFICPRGHHWDVSTAGSLTAHLDPTCPVCSAHAETTTGETTHDPVVRVPVPEPVPPPLSMKPPEPRHAAEPAAPLPPPRWTSTPIPDQPPGPSWWQRHGVAAGVTALACIAAGIAGYLAWDRQQALRHAQAISADNLQLVKQTEDRLERLRQDEEKGRLKAERSARIEMEVRKEAERLREAAVHDGEKAGQETERLKDAYAEAQRQRQQEATARAEAEQKRKAGEQVRQEALKQREQMGARLVRLYADAGLKRAEGGDLLGSLPWLTDAIRLSQGDRPREQVNRLRLAALLDQAPRPVQMWFPDQPYLHLQLSPDGRRLATAGRDGTARLWVVATGEPVGEVMKHQAPVVQASFSPDGKQLLTHAANGTVHLWDAASGKALHSLEYEGAIRAVSWAMDGQRLVASGQVRTDDGIVFEVRVWDAAKGELLEKAIKPGRPNLQAALSPDGKLVLTAGTDHMARLWSLTKGEQVGAAMEHADALTRAQFSPDGRHVLTASADGTARVWEGDSGRPVTPPLKHGQPVRLASFSPDGKHALTAAANGTVRLWDAATGEALGSTMKHGEGLREAVFSPDGRFVLTAGGEGSVRFWDTLTGEPALIPLPSAGPVLLASFSADGRRVLLTSGGTVALWDLAAGEAPALVIEKVAADHRWFSPDSQRELRATGSTAQLIDAVKKQAIGPPLKHKHEVSRAAFRPDGQQVLTVSRRARGNDIETEIQTWNAAGERVGQPIPLLTDITQLTFSPDGKLALAVGADKSVRIWDPATGLSLGKDIDHKEPVTHAVFGPDGKQVLTATEDGVARLWETTTGKPIGQPMKHRGPLNLLAYSSDGKQVLTASMDMTAAVWDAATGNPVTPSYLKHDDAVTRAAFSADGGRVVTASDDRTARVWDVRTSKPLTPPLKHAGPVTVADFSPDGKWLVTASGSTARVWDAATGEPLGMPLKHPSGTTVTHARIADKGRIITSTGDPHDPAARWTWTVAADDRQLAELLSLAQLLSGRRLDAEGAELAVEKKDVQAAWQELHKKYPRDFACPEERARAWHQRAAEECERQRLWTGVIAHLNPMIEVEPNRADLLARRGRAYAGLERWDRALENLRRAVELQPTSWELQSDLARAHAGLKKWDEAAAIYSRALAAKDAPREAWLRRAEARAELGQWREAADDFSEAIDRGVTDANVWRQHALARLAAGDADGYRKVCARLLRRHGDSRDPAVVRAVIEACVLSADVGQDLKPLLAAAETAAAAQPSSRPHLLALAALLLRTGQPEPAIERLQAARKLPDRDGPTEALLLAMAHQRQGRTDEAKKWLATAAKEAEGKTGAAWEQRLVPQLLRREAEASAPSPSNGSR